MSLLRCEIVMDNFWRMLVGAQRLIGNHMLVNHSKFWSSPTVHFWDAAHNFAILGMLWKSGTFRKFRNFTDFVEPPNAYYITKYLENNFLWTVSHLHVPSRKLTWLWKINHIQKMYVLLNIVDFSASQVSFPRCYVCWQMLGEVQIHRLQPFAHGQEGEGHRYVCQQGEDQSNRDLERWSNYSDLTRPISPKWVA